MNVRQGKKCGFTLIEVIIGAAVFLVISVAFYEAYVSLFRISSLNQHKIIALSLANEQLEIVRNLSYADVGEVSGIPNGKIPHEQTLVRGGISFTVVTTIRNVDLAFDGTIGGSPNDLSPADNKFAEVTVSCATCRDLLPITLSTTVAPKNLETASTNGALFIKVFDANGIPVLGASVHITSKTISPSITIDDVTDTNGMLQIVDVPPGTEEYEITVTKFGYSTDKTYPSGGVGNPAPSKTDATILIQQVTQVSFAIDRLSTMSFSSVTDTCVPVGNFDFSLVSSKNIGDGVPKYSQNLSTNSSGTRTESSMEWDAYTAIPSDASYDLAGISPLNQIILNPNSVQNVSLIVAPKNPMSLLVTVKDSSTQLPITGADVLLTGSSFSENKVTGRGFIHQTDWSGGGGQSTYLDTTKYASDDGNIEVSTPAGEIRLRNVFGLYNSAGLLESSTIDTGSPSNFYNLIWYPTDQPVAAGLGSLRLQFSSNATVNDSTTWSFKGPDGTVGSYYDPSNSVISAVHNNDRYVRYKVFLNTTDQAVTPNVSDVEFTFTSSCIPPGQVLFSGLSAGGYQLSVGKSGYVTSMIDISIGSNWKEQEIQLSP